MMSRAAQTIHDKHLASTSRDLRALQGQPRALYPLLLAELRFREIRRTIMRGRLKGGWQDTGQPLSRRERDAHQHVLDIDAERLAELPAELAAARLECLLRDHDQGILQPDDVDELAEILDAEITRLEGVVNEGRPGFTAAVVRLKVLYARQAAA